MGAVAGQGVRVPAAPGGKDGLVPDPRREGGQGGGKIQIRGPALRQLRQGLRAGVEALVDGGADVGVEGVVDGLSFGNR